MFYLIFVFIVSVVVSLIVGTFKDKKRYMVIVHDSVIYFSKFSDVKDYLSNKINRVIDYEIYVRDGKEYDYLTNYLNLE